MLIDELNNCIDSPRLEERPPQHEIDEVVRFLNNVFVKRPRGYYAFTTHRSNTTWIVEMVERYNGRTVRSVFLPRVENEGDLTKMEVGGQRPRCHEA